MSGPATFALALLASICASVVVSTLYHDWRTGGPDGGAYIAETSDEDPRKSHRRD